MLVINLWAGPGAGKSTMATAVFSLLKMHDINCEYVPEFAKDLTWEHRHKTLEDQLYILGKQQHRIWRLKDQVDIVITDSPIPLICLYSDEKEVNNLAWSKFHEYDNHNFIIRRQKVYNPKGRNQTEDEAKKIDLATKEMLVKKGIYFKEISGNISGIDNIVKMFVQNQDYAIIDLDDSPIYDFWG